LFTQYFFLGGRLTLVLLEDNYQKGEKGVSCPDLEELELKVNEMTNNLRSLI
jgi:hypothetical protein